MMKDAVVMILLWGGAWGMTAAAWTTPPPLSFRRTRPPTSSATAMTKDPTVATSSESSSNSNNNIGTSLEAAGDLLSRAACCLPNWYSSKEGLTGESPAVFGGAGTALLSAGQSWAAGNRPAAVCDLLTAACTLDPIDLGESLERAAVALENDDNDNNSNADAARFFYETASQLQDYGVALEAEEPAAAGSEERESAGNLLRQASLELQNVARQLAQ